MVDVVKAVVERIDNPDLDYAFSLGNSFIYLFFLLIVLFLRYLDLGKEYLDNRPEFNRKASEYVKAYALPRE